MRELQVPFVSVAYTGTSLYDPTAVQSPLPVQLTPSKLPTTGASLAASTTAGGPKLVVDAAAEGARPVATRAVEAMSAPTRRPGIRCRGTLRVFRVRTAFGTCLSEFLPDAWLLPSGAVQHAPSCHTSLISAPFHWAILGRDQWPGVQRALTTKVVRSPVWTDALTPFKCVQRVRERGLDHARNRTFGCDRGGERPARRCDPCNDTHLRKARLWCRRLRASRCKHPDE